MRILADNALYNELIDLCAIGKALYATTGARKYADYVMDDTPAPPAAPGPPQVRPRRGGRVGRNETGHPVGCPVLVFNFCRLYYFQPKHASSYSHLFSACPSVRYR